MKKQISLLLFLILLSYSGIIYSQLEPFYDKKNSSNALQMMNLKGKVKSVQQIPYKAIENGGIITKGEKIITTYGANVNSEFTTQFDTSTRVIKEAYPHGDKMGLLLIHKFDNSQNLETIEESEETGKVNFVFSYKYNDKGKIIEERSTHFYLDNTTYNNKFTHKYDAADKLIETDVYKVNGKVEFESKTIFIYDSKGNLSERQAYNEVGKPWFKYTFKYDDKGNELEENAWTLDNKAIDKTFVYKYDSNNNIIQKDLYQPAGKLAKSFTYKYEYDKNGNWIKRTDFIDKKASYILERKLEYY